MNATQLHHNLNNLKTTVTKSVSFLKVYILHWDNLVGTDGHVQFQSLFLGKYVTDQC